MGTNVKLNSKQIFRIVSLLYGYNDEIDYIKINDEMNELSIIKEEIGDGKKIRNEWKFKSDMFYINPSLKDVFNTEIINRNFFFNFIRNFKGTMLLITQSKDCFLKTNSNIYFFLSNCIKQIINECFGSNFRITITYVQIKGLTQYIDLFDSKTSNGMKQFKNINLIQNENEDIEIKDLVEVGIDSYECFEILFKTLEKIILKDMKTFKLSKQVPYNSHFRYIYDCNYQISNIKSKTAERCFIHDILTVRLYDSNKNFFSKFNFVLFKAFELHQNSAISNSKENSSFLNSIINKNFRESKMSRLLQDTTIHNCFILNILSVLYQYTIVTHDILNLIKPRKALRELDEDYLLSQEFDKLSLIKKQNLNKIVPDNNKTLIFDDTFITSKCSEIFNKIPEKISNINDDYNSNTPMFHKFLNESYIDEELSRNSFKIDNTKNDNILFTSKFNDNDENNTRKTLNYSYLNNSMLNSSKHTDNKENINDFNKIEKIKSEVNNTDYSDIINNKEETNYHPLNANKNLINSINNVKIDGINGNYAKNIKENHIRKDIEHDDSSKILESLLINKIQYINLSNDNNDDEIDENEDNEVEDQVKTLNIDSNNSSKIHYRSDKSKESNSNSVSMNYLNLNSDNFNKKLESNKNAFLYENSYQLNSDHLNKKIEFNSSKLSNFGEESTNNSIDDETLDKELLKRIPNKNAFRRILEILENK